MTILVISNDKYFTKDDAVKTFQEYTENEDLILIYSIIEAKEFIEKRVISEEQKHIDCIISDWKVENTTANELNDWLKNSVATYSSKNFKISSLPFILIEDKNVQSRDISSKFDSTITDFPNNNRKIFNSISSSIKNWRSALSDDLELIGLKPLTQKIYPEHRKRFISYYKLQVLTRMFVDDKSKKLSYIWTDNNYKKIEASNAIFYDEMKLMTRKPVKLMEKKFHDFFRANPTYLKGENFRNFVYEPHLYIDNTMRYNEPDFINLPFLYSLRNPEIFEVKRHTQRFFWKHREKMLLKARKSFEQVKRYKEYFLSKNKSNSIYIEKYLDKLYGQYEYSLLMGTSEEKEENEDLLDELKNEFDFNDIKLITYDELLAKHIRLCNRLNNFYKI